MEHTLIRWRAMAFGNDTAATERLLITRRYPGKILVASHEQNRGYRGATGRIQDRYQNRARDWMGFMDGDGG